MSAGNPQGSALAQELDSQLDDHINAMLEKNKDYKYKGGLSEDNWEEEIKSIPLFQTKDHEITQEQIDKSPELQALQALKYECDTPEESANALKDDGNNSFQKKKYKWAITAYTEVLFFLINLIDIFSTDLVNIVLIWLLRHLMIDDPKLAQKVKRSGQ